MRIFGEITEEDIYNEMRAVRKLCTGSNKHVVEVYQQGRLAPDSAFYFIDMELCSINLLQYIKGSTPTLTIPEWKIPSQLEDILNLIDITTQILKGLGFIHLQNEVHRDLNPGNGMRFLNKNKD